MFRYHRPPQPRSAPPKEGEKDRHRLSGPLSGRGYAPPYDQPRQPILPAIIVAAQPAIVVVATHQLAAASPTTGRDALRFTIYNAVRSNETRLAVWTEFDLEKAVWTIPGERMKARETHVVPLSPPAVALLRRRWNERTSDDGLVFSANGEKPISDMTMTKLLRNDGITGATVHGFRSSFTDWAAEKTDFPKEVADKALAHKLSNQVEAAYRRTDFFDKRRDLMARWAEYLDSTAMQRSKDSCLKLAA